MEREREKRHDLSMPIILPLHGEERERERKNNHSNTWEMMKQEREREQAVGGKGIKQQALCDLNNKD
jgi:hypothetical protein